MRTGTSTDRHRILAGCVAALAGTAPALADVPTYKGFQIQASTGDILFNLPPDASLSSATPDLNDEHEVTVSYFGVDRRAIWFGVDGVGGEIYNIPAGGDVFHLSDPTINNSGLIGFTRGDSGNVGIWQIDTAAMAPAAVPYLLLPSVSGYTGGRIADNGLYGFKGTANFTDFLADTDDAGPVNIVAYEASFVQASDYSFVGSPVYNNNRQWACRVWNDTEPSTSNDELRVFEADGSSARIFGEGDAVDGTTITALFNNVAIGDSGAVAVTVSLADGRRAMAYADASGLRLLSSDADPDIDEYRIFDPDINANDLVVYRALDGRGEDSIWITDGADPASTTLKLATVGTEIEGPSGQTLFIGRFIDSSPSLGGAVSMNSLGSVVFNAQLNDGTDLRGAAIIVAAVQDDVCLADILYDGILNNADINYFINAFLTMDPAADLNADGSWNNTDINVFINAFLAGCD